MSLLNRYYPTIVKLFRFSHINSIVSGLRSCYSIEHFRNTFVDRMGGGGVKFYCHQSKTTSMNFFFPRINDLNINRDCTHSRWFANISSFLCVYTREENGENAEKRREKPRLKLIKSIGKTCESMHRYVISNGRNGHFKNSIYFSVPYFFVHCWQFIVTI